MARYNVDQSLFRPIESISEQEKMRPSRTIFQETISSILKSKIAVVGLFLLIIIFFCAIFGPSMAPYGHSEQSLMDANLAPSKAHWFGTDHLGRDMWVRTWHGARVSLAIGLAAAFIDLLFGVVIGGVSGYMAGRGKFGDRVDNILMRIVEVLYGIPYLLVVILLMVMMEPGVITIIIALSVTGWIGMARIVRGEVLQLKQLEYVQAAQKLGTSHWNIIWKHLIPNTLGVIIVNLTFTIPTAIFAEAFLSFIGLGVQSPHASWGTMTNDALGVILSGEWWRLVFPAIMISITMFAFNAFGDGLQDVFDPRNRE